jgi:tRNA modification GTPase
VWVVRNKLDLINERSSEFWFDKRTTYAISALTGAGLDDLAKAVSDFATRALGGAEPALVTRERQRHALAATVEALRRAEGHAISGREDLFAEELRVAATAIGRLLGRVDVEDILDVIFRDFCIGK